MDLQLFGTPQSSGFTQDFVTECCRTVSRRIIEFIWGVVKNAKPFEEVTPEAYQLEKKELRSFVMELRQYRAYLENRHEAFVDEQVRLAQSLCGAAPRLRHPEQFVAINRGLNRQFNRILVYVANMEEVAELNRETYFRHKGIIAGKLYGVAKSYWVYMLRIQQQHAPIISAEFVDLYGRYWQLALDCGFLNSEIEEQLPELQQEVEDTKRRLYGLRRSVLNPAAALNSNDKTAIWNSMETMKVGDFHLNAKQAERACRERMNNLTNISQQLYKVEVTMKSLWLKNFAGDIRYIKPRWLGDDDAPIATRVMKELDSNSNKWGKLHQVEEHTASRLTARN